MPNLDLLSQGDVWVGLGVGIVTTGLIVYLAWRWSTPGQGCPLLDALHKESLGQDGAGPKPARGQDRRKAQRRVGNVTPVDVLTRGVKAAPVRGYVTDRSSGGIGLALPHEVAVGAIVGIRALNAPPGTAWAEIRVVRIGLRRKHYWHAGCEFVTTPPWSVLLLFG